VVTTLYQNLPDEIDMRPANQIITPLFQRTSWKLLHKLTFDRTVWFHRWTHKHVVLTCNGQTFPVLCLYVFCLLFICSGRWKNVCLFRSADVLFTFYICCTRPPSLPALRRKFGNRLVARQSLQCATKSRKTQQIWINAALFNQGCVFAQTFQ